ncbi:hypothetical protein [Flagellimonas sp.]|uniref:hypothetical protein n=1 Tax=Flagellimonas sp. TaxID=2058762 RepID=UPI003B50F7E4
MNKSFSYSNRKNPVQWFLLIFFGGLTLLMVFFMFWADEGHEIILIPLILALLPSIFVINKMFLTKLVISNDYIIYKSLFKSARIKKDRVQAIEILKKPRFGDLEYHSPDNKPAINLGRHFLIARSYYKPHSGNFLLYKPVKDDSYITAEYRQDLLESLLNFMK